MVWPCEWLNCVLNGVRYYFIKVYSDIASFSFILGRFKENEYIFSILGKQLSSFQWQLIMNSHMGRRLWKIWVGVIKTRLGPVSNMNTSRELATLIARPTKNASQNLSTTWYLSGVPTKMELLRRIRRKMPSYIFFILKLFIGSSHLLAQAWRRTLRCRGEKK